MTQDWQSDLENFFSKLEASDVQKQQQEQAQANENVAFFRSVVTPAFDEIQTALQQHGRQVIVHLRSDSGSLVVSFNEVEELNYSITTSGLSVFPETRSIDWSDGKRVLSEGTFRSGTQEYSVADISKEELIAHCLNEYKLGVANSQQSSG